MKQTTQHNNKIDLGNSFLKLKCNIMAVTVKKDINPLDFHLVKYENAIILKFKEEFVCIVPDERFDDLVSVLSMAGAYYNFTNTKANDDLAILEENYKP